MLVGPINRSLSKSLVIYCAPYVMPGIDPAINPTALLPADVDSATSHNREVVT